MSAEAKAPRPVLASIKFDADGAAYVQGSRCAKCSTLVPEERLVCIACGARGAMGPERLATKGALASFTIVYRSFPGVKTPFVAAIVDLEGGASIRGTLIDVQPDPGAIKLGGPVEMVFRETGQIASDDGAPFLSYYFTPVAGA